MNQEENKAPCEAYVKEVGCEVCEQRGGSLHLWHCAFRDPCHYMGSDGKEEHLPREAIPTRGPVQIDQKLQMLEADNAKLLELCQKLLEYSVGVPEDKNGSLLKLLKYVVSQPHPGSALLDEMAELKAKVVKQEQIIKNLSDRENELEDWGNALLRRLKRPYGPDVQPPVFTCKADDSGREYLAQVTVEGYNIEARAATSGEATALALALLAKNACDVVIMLQSRVTELESEQRYHAKAQCIIDKETAQFESNAARQNVAKLEDTLYKVIQLFKTGGSLNWCGSVLKRAITYREEQVGKDDQLVLDLLNLRQSLISLRDDVLMPAANTLTPKETQ